MKNEPLIKRFEDKFERIPEAGCWIWTASVGPKGYGMFAHSHTDHDRSHRSAWRIYRGPIPDGMFVLHRCDVPSCVNPEHLFLGTHKDNMQDMVSKGRGRGLVGSAHPESKLTEADVLEMRRLSKAGKTAIEIAAQFGVGKSAANYACNGTTWKHVK